MHDLPSLAWIRFHPLLGWPSGLLAMIKCSMKHRGLKTAIADLLTNPSLLTPWFMNFPTLPKTSKILRATRRERYCVHVYEIGLHHIISQHNIPYRIKSHNQRFIHMHLKLTFGKHLGASWGVMERFGTFLGGPRNHSFSKRFSEALALSRGFSSFARLKPSQPRACGCSHSSLHRARAVA